ncbi:MAG: hypothetical protein A2X23_04495 [Chloroflexi bacterium GWC2_73_18]|nr:MAG: hypothetical protein A2X23_04495 [Chloroflexi bacterium GWC2_73_18]
MNVLVSGGAGYIGAHVVRLLRAIFPKVAHIARLMRTAGIPHVHCHFASHPALAGFLIHRLTGIPFSFTAHGSDLHVDRHMLCPKVAEAAFVVAISEDNRAEIARECGERSSGKVMVIHCGVDTEALRPRDGRPAEGPFRILCIGTLHEVKGQAYLVEACRLLAEEGLDLTCRLVGDGPDRAALARRIAESGLQRQVVFTGWRTRGEVAELLHGADALVAPSVATRGGKREGIPVVLMEAMSSGVPVVASRLSGIPELVEDGRTGLLVPPRDAAALAAALKRLRDDPGLRGRLGEAAREKVIRESDVRRNAALLASDFRGGAAT